MRDATADRAATMYDAIILDHFRRPRNQRSLASATAAYEAHNPLCGDRVRLEIVVADGLLSDAAFTANACAVCTAAASLLTERVKGLPTAHALSLSDGEVLQILGSDLPAARVSCATLPLRALHGALAQRAHPV